MTQVRMPNTSEEAVEQLGMLGRLISAKRWERAAIIAMLVGPPPGQGKRTDLTSKDLGKFPYAPKTLAALGIHGLRSLPTIEHYRNQWCNNRPVPKPGEEVDLDGLGEWTGTTTAKKRETAKKVNTEAMGEAIMADDKVAKAAIKALRVRESKPRQEVKLSGPKLTADQKADAARRAEVLAIEAEILKPLRVATATLRELAHDWHQVFSTMRQYDKDSLRSDVNELLVLAETIKMNFALEEAEES